MKKIFICLLGVLLLMGCNAQDTPYTTYPEESSSSANGSDFSESSEPTPAPESESSEENEYTNESSESQSVQSSKPEISEPPKAESAKEVHSGSNTMSQPVENPSFNPKEGDPDIQQWVEALKKSRGISDISDYNAAIVYLEQQIESSLEDTQYGGTGKKQEEFTSKRSNETIFLTIGVKIFYIDIDKVKPVVTKIASNFSSAGEIDIEYIKCKYTLSELKEFVKEIQSQDFFEKYVSELSVYEGKVYARVKVGSKHLENFLSDKSYKDAVAIRSESTESNPAT